MASGTEMLHGFSYVRIYREFVILPICVIKALHSVCMIEFVSFIWGYLTIFHLQNWVVVGKMECVDVQCASTKVNRNGVWNNKILYVCMLCM